MAKFKSDIEIARKAKMKPINKILAKINKIILPSYTKRRLKLSKASKFQLGIIYWQLLTIYMSTDKFNGYNQKN